MTLKGVMCLYNIGCLFTTYSAISHIHSYKLCKETCSLKRNTQQVYIYMKKMYLAFSYTLWLHSKAKLQEAGLVSFTHKINIDMNKNQSAVHWLEKHASGLPDPQLLGRTCPLMVLCNSVSYRWVWDSPKCLKVVFAGFFQMWCWSSQSSLICFYKGWL